MEIRREQEKKQRITRKVTIQNGNKHIPINNCFDENGLSVPVKGHRVIEWMKKSRPICMLPMRDSFQTELYHVNGCIMQMDVKTKPR